MHLSLRAWISRTAAVAIGAPWLLTSCGGGGTSTVSGPAPAPVLALFAGQAGGPGNVDGTGSGAAFNSPVGIVSDLAGNLYVTDHGNRNVRKIDASGRVTTLAGSTGFCCGIASGFVQPVDGTGSQAIFHGPGWVTIDGSQNIYLDDGGTIRKISPGAAVTTLAGTSGVNGNADGQGASASFGPLLGLAADATGNVFVSDAVNFEIRKVSASGLVTTIAGSSTQSDYVDGPASVARFVEPVNIAIDSAGTVYICDGGSIRRLTSGTQVDTLAGNALLAAHVDAVGAAARFGFPTGLAVDAVGNLWVTDDGTVRVVTQSGMVSTIAGTAGVYGSVDGAGAEVRFNQDQGPGYNIPIYEGTATESSGNAYVADTGNSSIRKVTPAGLVTTIAGMSSATGAADGTGAAASFNRPQGLALDGAGNVYVADTVNLSIRKVSPTASVSTLAGGNPGGAADGTGSAAGFARPSAIASDAGGNLFVLDGFGLQTALRRVTPTGVVSTVFPTLYSVLNLPPPQINPCPCGPVGVAVDAADNAYLAVSFLGLILKVQPSGSVTILAGSASGNGDTDGVGTAAAFGDPTGIAVDASGNLYVAEPQEATIRKIDSGAGVTTIAGQAGVVGHADGSGMTATFNMPTALVVDAAGNVYVADTGNNTVRKITASNSVSTIAGAAGVSGYGPGSLPGYLNTPLWGVGLFGSTLYLGTNNSIMQVTNVP